MNPLDTVWIPFRSIESGAEAAAYSENCIYSLATLEIDRPPESTSFALTEQEYSDAWRWAIVDATGQVIQHGSAPTQELAKQASVRALAFHAQSPLFGLPYAG